ncbi:MAG: hypothetical protein ABFS17_01530 [Chloroflexota bacterium]
MFFIGFFLLFLFVAGDMANVDELSAGYLLFGVLFSVSGWLLLKSGRKPPEESGRFRTVRKLSRRGRKNQGNDEDDQEKEG